MSEEYQLICTTEPEKIFQLYKLGGSKWSGYFTPEEWGKFRAEEHVNDLKNGIELDGYYLEGKNSGEIVACCVIIKYPAFYKGVDRSHAISTIPEASLVGILPATALYVSYVYVEKHMRGRRYGDRVIREAMADTENKIIEEHITKSSNANDSFKNSVVSGGNIDIQLANYYLGKKYFWVLYSTNGTYYERFGFKGYPFECYDIPFSAPSKVEDAVKHLLSVEKGEGAMMGKKLRFLSWDSAEDQNLIKTILEAKELLIMMELNQMIFHSELGNARKSSSSLTNMTSMIQQTRRGSYNALSSIGESNVAREDTSPRRKSSILQVAVPKFALKPQYAVFKFWSKLNLENVSRKMNCDSECLKFNGVQGAIFTNELQHKVYYILWLSLLGKFYIISMGEMEVDLMLNLGQPQGRRTSSVTSLNELGGYNFQDLDILFATACYVGKMRNMGVNSVNVGVNDLPSDIPASMLNDYFLNYLPSTFDEDKKGNLAEHTVKLKKSSDPSGLNILPMVRRFGSNSSEFDLDWISNGMWSFL